MTINLVIEVSEDILRSVSNGGTVTVRIVRGTGKPTGSGTPDRAPATGVAHRYRAGSLPDKLFKWAEKRGREFDTGDVVKALGVTRAHASMILNKVSNDPGPIKRVARGVYGLEGGATKAPPKKTRRKAKKKSGKKK